MYPIPVTSGMFNSHVAINSDQAHVHMYFDTTHICLLTSDVRCNAMVIHLNI